MGKNPLSRVLLLYGRRLAAGSFASVLCAFWGGLVAQLLRHEPLCAVLGAHAAVSAERVGDQCTKRGRQSSGG